MQDKFEYIIKKENETLTDNPPLRICVNRIKNTITFKIKRVHYLKLLRPKTK